MPSAEENLLTGRAIIKVKGKSRTEKENGAGRKGELRKRESGLRKADREEVTIHPSRKK